MYTPGIDLSYNQIGYLIDFVFNAHDFPAITFFHRINVTNVINGHLKIPSTIMKLLKLKLGYLPHKGVISLGQFYDEIDMTTTYSMQRDGRMEVTGFSNFAHAAQLRVGSIVLITIEKHWPTIGNMKLLRLIFNDIS